MLRSRLRPSMDRSRASLVSTFSLLGVLASHGIMINRVYLLKMMREACLNSTSYLVVAIISRQSELRKKEQAPGETATL